MAGGFYLAAGLFGAAISSFLTAVPGAFISVMAGIALFATIAGSLHQALEDTGHRDAALVTFLITASGIHLLGISAPFWGLVIGGVYFYCLSLRRRT